jgi:hypothetical protein
MYYVMLSRSPDDEDMAMLEYRPDQPLRSWMGAARFSPGDGVPAERRPPPEPVRATVTRDGSGAMVEFWDFPVPLMSRRLHEALVEAGVDNLDVYRAEIVDPNTNARYDDYVAFNIVGTVSAADLTKSTFDARVPEKIVSMEFQSLTVDETRAQGALMFRLAEAVNAIVVEERVKRHVESKGFDTVFFAAPEDWAG